MNVGMFENAHVHDYMASYRNDVWVDRELENLHISEHVSLIATPGHTREDISVAIDTEDGLILCTHLWWSKDGPDEDPYSYDLEEIAKSRAMAIGLLPRLIVPGHGAPFSPTELFSN